MLLLTDVSVTIPNKVLVSQVNLTIPSGSLQILMGPNGSGKSTLAYALMGHPAYQVTGSMMLAGHELHGLSADKRAKAGLFLAFQHPYHIPGISMYTLLQEAHYACTGKKISSSEFKMMLAEATAQVGIDEDMLHRSQQGFSGGEKKRFELLQLLVLQPKVAILDEIDSGLDVDALSMVARALRAAHQKNPPMSFLIITHNPRFIDYLEPDQIHIMQQGTLAQTGDKNLAHRIAREGYHAR